jgi:uncharacterized protein
MMIEFSVENFRSFKTLQTLQLQAAKIKSKFPMVDVDNVFETSKGHQFLKSKAIFGANASGKSNLVRALITFVRIIEHSVERQNILQELFSPFALSPETKEKPTYFQCIFILNEVTYRYGFEIKSDEVLTEWLFGSPDKREVYYFIREGMEVKVNKNRFGEGEALLSLKNLTVFRKNSLFLSVAATLGGAFSTQLVNYFQHHISVISGLDDEKMMGIAMELFDKPDYQHRLIEMMQESDLGIENLEKIVVNDDDLPEGLIKDLRKKGMLNEIAFMQVSKKNYNENGKATGVTKFILHQDEAEGTKKIFMIVPFVMQTLDKGGFLVIDELDARLHPRLGRKIVELFNSKVTNPNNAQLVFVTHDTNLLDASLLRRDQVTFVEKDKFGASRIYTLVDYKGVRNDASFERDYLNGSYGAVPFLNRIDGIFYPKSTVVN